MSAAGIGHNSGEAAPVAADRLRSLVERIERLEEERRNIGSDIKDIYVEAKSAGFNTKVLRMVIRERRQDADELAELELEKDTYNNALRG